MEQCSFSYIYRNNRGDAYRKVTWGSDDRVPFDAVGGGL